MYTVYHICLHQWRSKVFGGPCAELWRWAPLTPWTPGIKKLCKIRWIILFPIKRQFTIKIVFAYVFKIKNPFGCWGTSDCWHPSDCWGPLRLLGPLWLLRHLRCWGPPLIEGDPQIAGGPSDCWGPLCIAQPAQPIATPLAYIIYYGISVCCSS